MVLPFELALGVLVFDAVFQPSTILLFLCFDLSVGPTIIAETQMQFHKHLRNMLQPM